MHLKDNLTSDNECCVKLIGELLKRSNLFGYGEVNQYNRFSTLMSAYKCELFKVS